MICILYPSQRLFCILAGEMKTFYLFIYFNNPNWPKANQLPIYKSDQRGALGTTENKCS